ncbi:MAG: DUF2752 domain-containing protein [Tepidisphaeraceae bacterium]
MSSVPITQPPPIYVRLDGPMRLPVLGRLLAALVAGGALAVLVTAAWLDPSPRGFGTHTQLGLQPCAFLQRTGIPCASCGMTTSFANLVHGHVVASFVAQPFGMILCILTAVTFWSAFYVAVTGKPAYRLLSMIPTRVHLRVWIPLALAAWVWKIALTVM